MKLNITKIILAFALSIGSSHCFSQGFVNLDFESATIVPVSGDSYNRVEFAPAFPGWTGSVGGDVQTLALYNNIFLDSSGIGIFDTNQVIDGNYTAMLEAGLGLGSSQPSNTTLSQTAVVPSDALSLLFEASTWGEANSFAVSMNGQTLSLTPLSTTSSYTLYGVNIRAWAGQSATLAFTVFAQQPHVNNNFLYLDDLQFSSSSVPEPGILGLFAIGGLFFGLRYWRNSSQ